MQSIINYFKTKPKSACWLVKCDIVSAGFVIGFQETGYHILCEESTLFLNDAKTASYAVFKFKEPVEADELVYGGIEYQGVEAYDCTKFFELISQDTLMKNDAYILQTVKNHKIRFAESS